MDRHGEARNPMTRAGTSRKAASAPPPALSSRPRRMRRAADLACVAAILLATLGIYAPALFGGRVLLPADTVLLMRPWGIRAATLFPEFRVTQNQMHGPIFEYYSWRSVARARLRQGEIPLWNPYELGGNVLLANSQSAVFYPPNFLLDVLPLPVGINWITALHTFLTGLFLYLFLRTSAFRPAAALTGAYIWMFCAVLTSWTEFQTPTAALCWLPGLLLCWRLTRRTGSARWALLGGGAGVALTLLAGHLQFAFYVILAYSLYALIHGAATWRGLWLWIGSLALGLCLSMCTTLPVVEMGRHNFRAVHDSYAASIALRLPPENLATLLLPNVLGNPRDHMALDARGRPVIATPYRGRYDFIEYACYVGVVGVILALLGLAALVRRRRRAVAWRAAASVGAIGLLGLLLALGTPVCALLFYGAPGYRQFNATARSLSLFAFGMAVVAAYGVQVLLLVQRRAPKLAAAAVAGACAVVGIAALLTYEGMMGAHPELFVAQWAGYQADGLRHALSCVALTLLVGVYGAARGRRSALMGAAMPFVAAADLIVAQLGFNPMTDPRWLGFPTDVTDYLSTVSPDRVVSLETPGRGVKSCIVPNYNATIGIREVQGADSLHTMRYHRWMEHIVFAAGMHRAVAFPDPNTIRLQSVAHPALDALNARYVTTEPGIDLPPDRFERVLDAELTVWRNRRAAGPAWIARRVVSAPDLDAAFRLMSAPGFSVADTAVVEGAIAGIPQGPAGPSSRTSDRVTVAQFRPETVAYDVHADSAGLLVASEIAMPGWRALVNGKPTPIHVADGVLRAVVTPAGDSRVVFRYEPTSYRLGLYLTAASLALYLGLLVALRRGGPRGRI